ncbi:RdgB/HAM1 family non-canonical purine NTP pyrophosphatase [Nocardioides astragali]|uniref:dITP/XTP pyrophosphatase n=1 Tax=Nocardioides astragali TaxID=1776736 RepID=A0ABW2N8Y3_9ACTN|nr:RdgB/HAM1 family non-canonical purine NTP pyrophosphatase [Nocardioides astragali]
MRVFLASRNTKKILEMQRILAEHVPDVEVLGITDVDGYDEPVEDQPTFAGNALLKARAGVAATGLPSIADDSGLCVDALNGMPGVLSARWAGQRLGDKELADARNNELLLEQLRDVPDERRGAHFACAVAWVRPDGSERVVEGRMDGRIVREQRGSGGFGYDVVFVAREHDAEGLTSAELEPGEKDRISHRGRALRELAPYVAADLTSAD